MAIEAESRFAIPQARFDAVQQELDRVTDLDGYRLRPLATKSHVDTYYDIDGQLFERKWALRTRETGDRLHLTLKRPVDRRSASGDAKDELESDRDGSIADVLEQICQVLYETGLIEHVPDRLEVRLARDGVELTLRRIGLQRMFSVQTQRRTWTVADSNGVTIAEMALDNSDYTVGASEKAREYRLEVELSDPARSADLDALSRRLTRRFNITEVHDSKYERGVTQFRSQNLRDKMEAKVSVATADDYRHIIQQIRENPHFLDGYRFKRIADRVLDDVYFDTKDLRLFRLGFYLRLRRESDKVQLVFRRLTKEARYGQILQQETVVDWSGDLGPSAWRSLGRNLADKVSGLLDLPEIHEPGEISAALKRIGLVPSLHAKVSRRGWIIERDSTDTEPLREHVAKLKLDDVTFSRPSRVGEEAHMQEFEVTGVESDDAAPSKLRRDMYHTFLSAFVEACAHHSADVRQRISAKYFEGISMLGISTNVPSWLTDGRLDLRVSMAREPDGAPYGSGLPNRALARFWSYVAVLVGGLLALSSGYDSGLVGGGQSNAVSVTIQILGLVAVVFGSLILFRDPSPILSRTWQVTTVTICLVAAVAVSIPWFGRQASAETVGFLGLLPIILLLARSRAQLNRPPRDG